MIEYPTVWVPRAAVMQAIPVGALHNFLARRGWVQRPSSYPAYCYYEHATQRRRDGSPVSCHFPASNHLADYPLGVLTFIQDYAVNWQIDPHAILAELQGGPVAEPLPASASA